ncbi:GNAT family N-acetyltransferase [Thiorhodococcus minor]|uniref:GNAT family N-acetyltransferase n=1 Tax=Thiorhodococcus minor TaxID=57489 RepID=A0A6M0K2L3_9GAMM|nr:GNAT family N-acetyltransferase [Thiorhodococcus minor]NEV62817.1 GNAT family N-acetyltransferase [Thiorhodococcus minor]
MREYELRVATTADEPALIELFGLVFGEGRSSEEWRWKFVASRDLADGYEPADSMVAVTTDGAIVAHAGVVTLPGYFKGASIPFVQVCDVMVHPKHRGGIGKGNLFTALLRTLLSRVAERLPTAFAYGFPGRGPYLVGERARVYELIEVAAKIEIPAKRSWAASWRVVDLSWDDRRLDAVWDRLKEAIGLGLVRNGAYLRWRYASSPTSRYRLVGLVRFGRLNGWAVVCSAGGEWRVVDILALPSQLWNSMRAVAAYLERRSGASELWGWLPGAWRERLHLTGVETPVMATAMCWRGPIPAEVAREHLYYTMGDVDIF